MIKKMLVLFAVVGLFACNQTQKNNDAEGEEVTALTVADIKANAADYVDQEVTLKGTVTHVCKHGGKRLFLMDDNPDETFKIEAGDELASFDAMLEGGIVEVSGIIRELRVDEDYLQEWEAELAAEVEKEDGEEKHLDGAEHSGEGELDQIEAYRQKMKDLEVDHLSFYSMEGVSYNPIELVEIEEVEVTDTIEAVIEEVSDTIEAVIEEVK